MVAAVVCMDGLRQHVQSADGTSIGTLTAGSGPPLLLVHGGLSGRSRFAPLWAQRVPHFRVTAIDRRGRGTSGDAPVYDARREYEDVCAAALHLATDTNRSVDVFGHSFGAVCALGAAAEGAPIRRLILYEPPGPATVPVAWRQQIRGLIESGHVGAAVASFLSDVVGLTDEQVAALKDTAGSEDVFPIASRTLVREAEAIARLDFDTITASVEQAVLLLVGNRSPTWAGRTADSLARLLASAELVQLPGQNHESVDTAPNLVTQELCRFLTQ